MFKDIVGQAWEAMIYNRRRTAITMIGMAWGIATVVLLLAYGADANVTAEGQTAASIAARRGDTALACLLREAAAHATESRQQP